MKTFWTIVLLLTVAAVAALLTFGGSDAPDPSVPVERETVVEPTPPVPVTPAGPAAAPTPLAPAAPAQLATDVAGTLDLGMDAVIPSATVRRGNLVRQGDAILADGKFLIRGDGSSDRPYEISWDLLVSASDSYIPRLGEKSIPQRIALLHGSHVVISGFVAFPLIATEASECLIMLNQWDGCCIGIPPSPYDAIEVKLSAPADNSKRHTVRVGSIQGILRIDPYVVEKWLVGLYTMDSATLSSDI